MKNLPLRVLLLLPLSLAGCGGTSRPTSTADRAADEEDDDRVVDEEAADEEEDGEAFVDEAMLRETDAPIELGDAATVAGTGVTLRPPSGSEPMPFAAGFLALRHRVQISVVVANGPPGILETVRTGGDPDAPEPEHEEPFTVAEQRGRIGHDRVSTPGGELERSWLLAHDGTRGLAVIATYEASRAERLRPLVRESLASVQWDRAASLDAGAAIGVDVGPVQGLRPSHTTTANLLLIGPRTSIPPEPGQVVATVSPLPMRLASEQTASACGQLMVRLMNVPADAVRLDGEIEDGRLSGCERLAVLDSEAGQLATYAAIVFADGTPIVVTATVDAAQVDTWRPRFASLARTVRARQP